jgi:tRNA(adenine34) deaminase
MTPMEIALAEARAAAERGEVPVGAVVLDGSGAVLARAGNEVEAWHDASAHAEMLALRAAAAVRGAARLPDCELVVSLDPKGGGVEHGARVFNAPSCHHRPEVVGGVQESEAARLLRNFFGERR